eukprot:SAG11_NODE_293_length_11144_cov_4.661928_5_plen_71_part_00
MRWRTVASSGVQFAVGEENDLFARSAVTVARQFQLNLWMDTQIYCGMVQAAVDRCHTHADMPTKRNIFAS